ncbi:hypothetical protein [Alkalitalea saponilacus]|nr:hypothetical protein [Alkalitalea saponilacus]ASB48447.1 hypothetical protein CDL62_04475 [Alkalitalea saponilacus]
MSKLSYSYFLPKHFFVLIFAFLLITSSCRIQLIADYDANVAEQIGRTAMKVERFYLTMLETTTVENNGRAYDHFTEGYIDVEVELISLLNRNRVRPLNENSVRICEITLELWQKYKMEHKEDNSISDGVIGLNRLTFSDLFFAMQVAERAKELID